MTRSRSYPAYRLFAGVLLVLALSVSACSAPMAGSGDNGSTSNTSSALEYSLLDIPPMDLHDPLWSVDYSGAVRLAMSRSGSTWAMLHMGNSSGSRLTLTLYGGGGDVRWTHTFSDRALQSGQTVIFAEGERTAVAVYREDQTGQLLFFDQEGKVLWSRELTGPIILRGSSDGTALAVIDRMNGLITFFADDGTMLSEHRIGGRASVQFIADGSLALLEDDRQVALVRKGGETVWKYSLDKELSRNVLITNDGDYIAVATGQKDSTIYLFNSGGKALWKYPLEYGGANRLQFSDGDELLAVYDVGEDGGIYLFDVYEGRLLWRARFKSGAGHDIALAGLYFGSAVATHLLDTFKDSDDQLVTVHYLVGFTEDGAASWKVELGSDVSVIASPGFRRVLVKQALPAEGEAGPLWRIRLYDAETLSDQ